MIDHVGLRVADVESAKKFYKAALKPLGYELAFEGDWGGGFKSSQGHADFWLSSAETVITPGHVAFNADSRDMVNAFHEAALAAGGNDNGPPGLRPHYHENYYGAFVHDADGNNIEAVCHKPEA